LASSPSIRSYASAGGVVLDSTGRRVLVLRRPARSGPDGRPEVRLPKGHIEPGESRRQAALREVCEETGLCGLQIVADLGHLSVEFDYKGAHYVRDESYFLMTTAGAEEQGRSEVQFQPLWLGWDEAQAQLTFEAEREWLRRAREAASLG
jgi:8-oxo-dGTP pyrophosphatase MutT (NUDIX family)